MIENREGGDNTTVHKLPGKTSYADITLKWGLTDSTELWDWRQQIIDGNVITQERLDRACSTWPTAPRWRAGTSSTPGRPSGKAPSFSAKGNDIAIETLVLAARGADPGVSVLVTEHEFELPKGYVDAGATCTATA